jgi:hypothetical protein
MKYRWIGGPLLVAALALGACAPPDQGAGESSAPADATTEATSSPSADPAESVAPSGSESAEPTPDSYEY